MNWRLSVCMIGVTPGIDKTLVHKIIDEKDLLFPKVLTDDRKQPREAVSKDLLRSIESLTEMKLGFSSMNLKQNSKAANSTLRNSRVKRRIACQSPDSKHF
ncbi:unnamed protein product [Hermetia illucens]|uniref:Uncharacterized protein n=1 Tax=Hermetia illucens TaxID=343691 RepID=A0A7R8YYH7_HERIL|nr:unnamed protein product [Hermetia illucens]